MSSSSEPSTTSAAASASSPGGNSWLGIAITRRPAARAARMPLCESSIPAASRRVDAEPPRRLQEHVGRRLAARRPPRTRPRSRNTSPQPDVAITRSMTSLVGGRGERERPARGDPRDRLLGAGEERQPLRVALEHVRDDAVGDLLRLERDAQLVAHVARPLGRAHAEHRLRRAVGPRAAVLGDQRPAPAVPGGLRVEQEAVEVEDDGADQAGDQGIEPQPAVLETAILTVGPVPRRAVAARL